MKITGIIAEYNPFHNGHAYQIAKIKEETDSDYVIVAMSGDFVQRENLPSQTNTNAPEWHSPAVRILC